MIPLVDVKAQYARADPGAEAGVRRGAGRAGSSSSARTRRPSRRRPPTTSTCPRRSASRNGTDALVLALDAMGIGPGDEVICPAFTFYATAEAIARRGATPVFAEVEPETMNLDVEDVAARITPRTKAIMPVHLFGRPAPLAELAALGVAADRGRRAGVRLAGRSRPRRSPRPSASSRRRTCSGSATAASIATRDAELGERIRMLRFHGSKAKKTFEYIGYNSRLDEIQAAALRIFLRELDGWTRERREAAARYRELGLGDLVETPERRARPRLPPVRLPLAAARRDPRGARASEEIATAHYYEPPLHLQPALAYLGYGRGLAARDRAARPRQLLASRSGPASTRTRRSRSSTPCARRVRL